MILTFVKVQLALQIEEKLPWIRRKLKKRSYRVEKYPKRPCCLFWYEKLSNSIFGNSFEELEQNVNDLQSEDKLSSLLQGLEVIKVSFAINKCTHAYIYLCNVYSCVHSY